MAWTTNRCLLGEKLICNYSALYMLFLWAYTKCLLPGMHAGWLQLSFLLDTEFLEKKKEIVLILRTSIARCVCILGKWFYDYNLFHHHCPEVLVILTC